MYGEALLQRLQGDFLGLESVYTLADGRQARRIYLDSAASTLRMGAAQRLGTALLAHYANTHSELHFGARTVNHAYQWAHQQVLEFVQADQRYSAFFAGNGTTAGLNRMARTLAHWRPERDLVLVSTMEHHSNDLPHRQYAHVLHLPLTGEAPALGAVDLAATAALLEQYGSRVNYIAVTGASNVTGILNPVAELARLAHTHGAYLLVDGAQWVAHAPVSLQGDDITAPDVLVFAGHKIYAPGAPGVVVARRELLLTSAPAEVGGGMVEDVFLDSYQPSCQLPEREEAGTPDIIGAVMLGAVLALLRRVGMSRVQAHEQQLLRYALEQLRELPLVQVYGEHDLTHCPRTGLISFNIEGMPHALTAAILNDYFAIAVRNACFCAHPYVRELLKPELWALDIDPDSPHGLELVEQRRGMARISLGLYNTQADIDAWLAALRDISAQREFYTAQYQWQGTQPVHKHFHPPVAFEPEQELERALAL